MTTLGKQRIEAALGDKPCHCNQESALVGLTPEGGDTATLVKRKIKQYISVYLQCDTCGAAIGGALARSEHYYWQDYPEWDAERGDRWRKKWESDFRQKTEKDRVLRFEKQRKERERRSEEYAQFCRESPYWHRLRDAVLERASYICESCLSAPADTAHHLTYEFGLLPPAWHLRAVCKACHNRLHARKNLEIDDWDPGSWSPDF